MIKFRDLAREKISEVEGKHKKVIAVKEELQENLSLKDREE